MRDHQSLAGFFLLLFFFSYQFLWGVFLKKKPYLNLFRCSRITLGNLWIKSRFSASDKFVGEFVDLRPVNQKNFLNQRQKIYMSKKKLEMSDIQCSGIRKKDKLHSPESS